MALREVVGHEAVVARLKKSVAGGRVSHAYLFYGPDGVGKELAAKNFAKLLNCRSPKEGDACDFCRDCVLTERGAHPDVIWLRPVGPARIIRIDDVRDFQKAVSLKPHMGRWKVGVFVDAHALNTVKAEAGNALLKTLEEPPDHTILILVTARREILLPTIVSRCQAVRFTPMREDSLREILRDTYSLSSENAGALSRLCGGRFGEAMKALREDRLSEARRIARSMAKGERGYWTVVAGLLDSIEESMARGEENLEWQLAERGLRGEVQGGEDEMDQAAEKRKAFAAGETTRRQEELLGEFLSLYRDVMVWKLTGEADLLISAATLEEIRRWADGNSLEQAEQSIRLIEAALRSLRRNANFHAVMENLLVQLSAMEF